jgi:hypothetical protein
MIDEKMVIPMVGFEQRQEGESDRAWLAFEIYRDMGAGRTIDGAYLIYRSKVNPDSPKLSETVRIASPSFKEWSRKFNWLDRVKDWDGGHAKRLQEKLLAADQEKYINSVEKLRSEVEAVSKELMQTARISNSIALRQLSGIASKIGKQRSFEPMPKDLLREHSEHTSTAGNAAKILVIAIDKLSEALGLERIIEGLNNAKDSE